MRIFVVIGIFALVAVVTLCSGYYLLFRNPHFVNQKRAHSAIAIYQGLANYFAEHEKLPERLSSLCPTYISSDRLDVWFPTRDATVRELPTLLKDTSRIDENCDYLYFPKVAIILGNHPNKMLEIVLCERPYPGTANAQFMAMFNDFSMQIISRGDLEQALSRTRAAPASEAVKPALTPVEDRNGDRTIIKLKKEDIP